MAEYPARDLEVAINLIDVGERKRKPDMKVIGTLADDIARHGILQRIGLRERGERFDLIWGRNRLEAAAKLAWPTIAARVYPPETPDALLEVLELVENLKRQELTTEEREAHTLMLAAAIKKADNPVGTSPTEDNPGSTNRVVALPTGRGHKGVTAQVAEREGVTKQAVQKRVKKVEQAIGEKVDLQRDSPEELQRKAKARKQAPQAKPKPKPAKSTPKPSARPSKPATAEEDAAFARWLAFGILIQQGALHKYWRRTKEDSPEQRHYPEHITIIHNMLGKEIEAHKSETSEPAQ